MSLLSDWRERLRGLALKRRSERELDAELRFHVEQEVAHRIREGADPVEARRAALLAFGGIEQFKEEVRDARGTRGFEELLADVRYAVRNLGRHPIFTAAAVVVLGLGLGASTTVFAVVDAVLLARLPHPDADRLLRVYQQNPSNRWAISTVDAQAIIAQQQSFESVGALRVLPVEVPGPSGPDQLLVGWATAGFFDALRTPVAIGRPLRPDDETPGAPAVALVSDAMARQRWGDPARAVGQPITIDGTGHEIVGVFPPSVRELAGIRAELWTALQLDTPSRRGPFWLRVVGRLKPGATLESATRDLAGISERIFPLWATGFRDQTAKLTPVPLVTTIVGDAGQQVNLFAAAVGLVLLVAIANVATLMLVRASGRAQEFGVRLALGAGKGRLARLLVTDGVILTLAAGVFGLMVASAGVRLVTEHVTDLPRIHHVALDARALGFLLLAALASGLAISAPAMIASLASRASTSLRIDTRRAGTDRRTGTIRSALVVAEFALALPLLVGASLLVQSLIELRRVDPGFDPEGVVTATLALPNSRYGGYPAIQTFWRQLEQRVHDMTEFTAVGMTLSLPPDESDAMNNFDLLDKPVPSGGSEPTAPWVWVTPGYFATLNIPLLEGRMFTPADSGLGPPVVLVSAAWAKRYYPEGSAVGKQMVSGGCTSCPLTTVVGVVGDVKYQGLTANADAVYQPLVQATPRRMHMIARTPGSPADAIRSIQEMVRTLDAELPVATSTLTARLGHSLAAPRRWTAVLVGFAVTAATLAALGIFGLMSYTVRQERRTIGIRLALGAAPDDMTSLIVRRGLRHAGIGITVGLGLTLLEGRWLGSLLYGVRVADPVTMVAVAIGLFAVAALACWLPGRQAARVDAREALTD